MVAALMLPSSPPTVDGAHREEEVEVEVVVVVVVEVEIAENDDSPSGDADDVQGCKAFELELGSSIPDTVTFVS